MASPAPLPAGRSTSRTRCPGLTNRILARLAGRVLEAMPGTFPARSGARAGGGQPGAPGDRRAAAAGGALCRPRADRRGCSVLGGSQGARALNERAAGVPLARLAPGSRPAVRHQCRRAPPRGGPGGLREAGYRGRRSSRSSRTWPRPTAGPTWSSAARAR
ncbi:MAG: hypothetical protein U5K43_11405 [Halofilum sp. (in: g-proteobacteria)]|nr:hypothetical protein [Halofilum sp. (in: g-proteobacteria)]